MQTNGSVGQTVKRDAESSEGQMNLQETSNTLAKKEKEKYNSVDPWMISQVLAVFFPKKTYEELYEAAMISYLIFR